MARVLTAMGEQVSTTEPTPQPVQAPETATAPEVLQEPAPVDDPGKRAIDAMKAQWHSAKAEAAGLAQKLQEIEDRDKSELQRAQEAAQRATSELAGLQRVSMQQQVALEKGLPASIVAGLQGATVEEMQAHADALLAWRGAQPAATPAQPRPDMGQGVMTPGTLTPDVEYAEYEKAFFNPNKR